MKFQIKDVLKRVLFYELYFYFPKSEIIPTPEPFVGAINYNGKIFYVYVSREDNRDLIMYLKWKENRFSERIIVITESTEHVNPLMIHAQDMKLRTKTDQELMARDGGIYFHEEGKFVKEG